MTDSELFETAIKAREKAYAPYSDYKVGAALLCSDGNVYCGCNIENKCFSPTVCAERTAVFSAIADGHRDFVSIAVAGAVSGKECTHCTPCGVCRQVLAEFCDKNFRIIFKSKGALSSALLSELLPLAFET